MKLNYEELFNIPLSSQKINGTYPYLEKNVKWFIQTGILMTLLSLWCALLMYNLIYFDIRSKNFSQICRNGTILVVCLYVFVQYSILMYYKDNIELIKQWIQKDYDLSGGFDKIEQAIVENYASEGVFVCKQWLITAISATFAFVVQSVGYMIYYYIKDEFKLVLFYELILPGIIEENKNNIYVYLFTYFVIALTCSSAATLYASYEPLGLIAMLHASGQLELVKGRIDNIFSELNDDIIKEKLRSIIIHLQYIYSFVATITSTFQFAYEFSMKVAVIALPFAFYEVLQAKNRGELRVDLITFITGSLLIVYSPCYYSDLLLEKSENVRLALYTCGWELHYEGDQRRIIQILLLYALKPIAIRTVFRTICLDTLTDFIHQSYAIFNLMTATM